MAIPSSGTVSLTTIQTEYGGSNPISLSEYYRGGTYVPNSSTTTTMPTYSVDFSSASTTVDYGILDQVGTINILSSTIAEGFIDYDHWQTFRTIASYMMYASFAYWFLARALGVTI